MDEVKLLPCEPTPEMMEAGIEAYCLWEAEDRPSLVVESIFSAMIAARPTTVVTDEVVERDELLELLELAGDYAADVFNEFRDKTGECALRVAANLARFNKAHSALASMPTVAKDEGNLA